MERSELWRAVKGVGKGERSTGTGREEAFRFWRDRRQSTMEKGPTRRQEMVEKSQGRRTPSLLGRRHTVLE